MRYEVFERDEKKGGYEDKNDFGVVNSKFR